LDKVEEVFG